MEHIYRSIKAFNHEVFKYHGAVKPEDLGFYTDHFQANGITDSDPYAQIVVFSDERPQADRITFNPARAQSPSYCDSGILYVAPEPEEEVRA